MALCPHCHAPIALVRSVGAVPAFPGVCGNCGGRFHSSGVLATSIVASAGLALALAATVMSGQSSVGGSIVIATLIGIVLLARRSTLVPSTADVVFRWRLAIGLLILASLVLELLPGGLLRYAF